MRTNLETNAPPDVCNEQSADCCCNSIAFALAMLCLNCQHNIGTGAGYDAGAGAYGLYLRAPTTCSPVKNQTLPASVQDASILGYWRLVLVNQYTWQTTSLYIAAQNNNTFTHCAATARNNTSGPSSAPSSSNPSSTPPIKNQDVSSSSSDLGAGAIGGIVGGVITGLFGTILILWFWWKKREGKGFPDQPFHQMGSNAQEVYSQPGENVSPSDSYRSQAANSFPWGHSEAGSSEEKNQSRSPMSHPLDKVLYLNQNPSILTITTTMTESASPTSPVSTTMSQTDS
ncbi:hypothetical protein BDP27DRAFT_1448942 [Rhodocollybia butyracea]|uniref:Uncharacterized protein n=1 Tax=Rhodocollybia butyracea TaxID=206335 RepID=A0A9P5PKW0_9AGAR|nr:hypothetical protein BDP27DRAFT_1448942 [Rhodocollybia butyracea]